MGTKHYEIGKREFRGADVGLGDGGFSESWSKSIAAGRSVSGPASGDLDVCGLLRVTGWPQQSPRWFRQMSSSWYPKVSIS